MTVRFQHREKVLQAAIAQVIDHPFEQLSFNGIAEASGVTLWALRYNFENVDGLFRAAGDYLVDRVKQRARAHDPASPAVLDTIAAYARFVADLVRSPEYRDLLYFVIRNGRRHPGLRKAYQSEIVGRICSDLEALVLQSGERHGITILLRDQAARRFHRRIETELALSSLLADQVAAAQAEVDKLLKDVVRETYEATYAFEWGAASAA